MVHLRRNLSIYTTGSILVTITTIAATVTSAFVVPKQQWILSPSSSLSTTTTAVTKSLWNNHHSSPLMYRQKQRESLIATKMMMSDPTGMLLQVPDMISTLSDSTSSCIGSSNILLSFSDQGQNLAGLFFQASLVPYLLFLYFLSFRANRISPLGNFGFQFVLLFVLSTIPSGIISRSLYGFSLADTDWLHGGAEALLTTANVLIVLGFKEAMTKQQQRQSILNKGRLGGLVVVGLFGLALAIGPTLISNGHVPFLGGIGNIPSSIVEQNLPWIIHTEPVNALSIPTWAIHFSSVFEYLFAMSLVWQFAIATQNETWKGLTWGMLPLHASGICACTYHFFYNDPSLQFLVTTQAGLTLLGNITCMIAAYRIAVSNGWNLFSEIPFLPKSPTSATGLLADGLAAKPLVTSPDAVDSTQSLAIKLTALTVLTSYVVKYGELGLDLPFAPNAPVAVAMVVGFPGIVALQYYFKSQQIDNTYPTNTGTMFSNLKIPSFFSGTGTNDTPTLSMADVKKYGVAGTVAYVLTELAFWIVAFPVAATALYQSTGHWPDVVTDTTDRAAVLAFIFAGANIARAFVPIRLGAALALAPWVDENIINRTTTSTTSSKSETIIDVPAESIEVDTRKSR